MQHPFPFSSSSSSSFPPSSTPHPPNGAAAVNGRGQWAPYSSSKNFDVNMGTILIILVLATVLAFALHAAFCFLLRLCLRQYRRRNHHHHHHHHLPSSGVVHNKQSHNDSAYSVPTLVFSRGTKLAGGADDTAECAICLSEFLDGEQIRVLPACNHGFHVKCVEMWLVSKSSCPTCRTSCLLPVVATAAEP